MALQGYVDLSQLEKIFGENARDGCLTDTQINNLASAVTFEDILAVATYNLDMDDRLLSDLKWQHHGDVMTLKREILRCWRSEKPAAGSANVSMLSISESNDSFRNVLR